MTIADARAQIDQLVRARSRPRSGSNQEWCQRVAELWWEEARVWTWLAKAADLPRDSDMGALLAAAAGHAAMFAHRAGVSWWAQSGDPERGSSNGLAT